MDDSWGIALNAEDPASKPELQKQSNQQQEIWQDEEDGEDNKNQKNQLDESNWLDQIKKSQKEASNTSDNRLNNTSLPNTSFLQGVQLPVGEHQLNPDEPNTTFFQDGDKKKEESRGRGRGNREFNTGRSNQEQEREPPKRDNRQKYQEDQPPRRGNRQGRQEDVEQKEVGQPRRGNRTYRQGQQEGPPRRGNRDRDTGEGGGGFKKKEFYQVRDSQYERGGGGYRGNRGGYRGRGGNSYNGNYNSNYRGYNPRYRQKNDNEEPQQSRGENQDRQWKGRNNYQDRDQRTNNRYEGRNYNQNYNRPQRYHNQPYRQPNRQTNNFNQNSSLQTTTPSPLPTENSQLKNTHITSTQRIPPKGRKCWPEASLYILNCRFVVTTRQLTDFRCKLLVMPYSTIQMEFYPGNVVNSSSVDYRKKITNKGKEIQDPGSVYLQKALNVYTFQAIAFVKVSRDSIQQSLKKGINQVLKLVEKIEKPITLESLVFPICSELGDPNWVINPFLSQLQNCRKIKQVWITTIEGSCFTKAVEAYNTNMQTLFKSNEIFLN